MKKTELWQKSTTFMEYLSPCLSLSAISFVFPRQLFVVAFVVCRKAYAAVATTGQQPALRLPGFFSANFQTIKIYQYE